MHLAAVVLFAVALCGMPTGWIPKEMSWVFVLAGPGLGFTGGVLGG